MEPKTFKQKITPYLWGIGGLLAAVVILGFFIDYPDWLSRAVNDLLLVALGIVLLYQAYRMRKTNRQYALIYLVIGLALLVVPALSVKFLKVAAVIGLAAFVLTNKNFHKLFSKSETPENK